MVKVVIINNERKNKLEEIATEHIEGDISRIEWINKEPMINIKKVPGKNGIYLKTSALNMLTYGDSRNKDFLFVVSGEKVMLLNQEKYFDFAYKLAEKFEKEFGEEWKLKLDYE